MSILTAPAAFVQSNRQTCRECGEPYFHIQGCTLEHAETTCVFRIDCQSTPVVLVVAESDLPTIDDEAWWTEHCDHSDWPIDGELSPEEQEIELEHLEYLNDCYERAFSDDLIAGGIPMW